MHLSFPCRKKNIYSASPECRLPIIAYGIGYFRCHPSLSPLTDMRHLHPDCWVKKWAVQDFIFGFTFFQLPPFFPSLAVGRTDTSFSSPYLRRASRAAFQPIRTVAVQQADGEYFLQPRSQYILHQLKCCWEESGRFWDSRVCNIYALGRFKVVLDIKFKIIQERSVFKIVAVPGGGPEIVASSYFLLRKRHLVQLTQLVNYNFLIVCFFFCFCFCFLHNIKASTVF